MNQFLEWLKYLLLGLAIWAGFWSYGMIRVLQAQVDQLVEMNQKLTTQIEKQCNDLGYVKPNVDNP
jgi:hypothetical protein